MRGGVDRFMDDNIKMVVGGEWAWVVKQDERVGVVLHTDFLYDTFCRLD